MFSCILENLSTKSFMPALRNGSLFTKSDYPINIHLHPNNPKPSPIRSPTKGHSPASLPIRPSTDTSTTDPARSHSPSPCPSDTGDQPGDATNQREKSPLSGGSCDGSIGGDSGNGGNPARRKKTRTVFSRNQVFQLESTFDLKRYLSSAERAALANNLNLSEQQIKIWFQ